MFRGSSAHLQEDTIVYMQHMVLPLSTRACWPVGTQVEVTHVNNCILLMMSTWGSKHVEEN